MHIPRTQSAVCYAPNIVWPLLPDALKGYDALFSRIETVCTELKTAMFLTGAQNISALGKVRYYLTGTVREMTNK